MLLFVIIKERAADCSYFLAILANASFGVAAAYGTPFASVTTAGCTPQHRPTPRLLCNRFEEKHHFLVHAGFCIYIKGLCQLFRYDYPKSPLTRLCHSNFWSNPPQKKNSNEGMTM